MDNDNERPKPVAETSLDGALRALFWGTRRVQAARAEVARAQANLESEEEFLRCAKLRFEELRGRVAEFISENLLKECFYGKAKPVFRIRKGKLVQVPPQWVGRVTGGQRRNARRERARLKRKARRRALRGRAELETKEQTE